MSALKNPLGRARGHGSARDGVHHWIMQRATSLLLVLLVPWALYSAARLAGAGHAETAAFVAQPGNATLLTLLVITLLYHAVLGLQVVIEDYVHARALEIALHFLVRALAFGGMVLGVIHILKLALGP